MKHPSILWHPATFAAVGGAVAVYFAWPRGEGPSASTAPTTTTTGTLDSPGTTEGSTEASSNVEPPPRQRAAVLALLHLGSRVGRVEELQTRPGGRAAFERHVRLRVRRGERHATVWRSLRGVTDDRGLLAEATLQAPGLEVMARALESGKHLVLTVLAHGHRSEHPPVRTGLTGAALPALDLPIHVESTVFPWLARGGFRTGRSERVAWLDLEHGRLQETALRIGERRQWHGIAGTEIQVSQPYGIEWTALVDDAGRILQSDSAIPGLQTQRWRPADDSRPLHAVDLGSWGLVMTSGSLPISSAAQDGGRLRSLRLGVRGVPSTLLPAEVEIRAAPLPADEPAVGGSPEIVAELAAYGAAAPFLERDAPAIRERAQALAPAGPPPLRAARAIADFVAAHVSLRDAVGPPSALATLQTRRGNCNELAALSVALLRAAGHPARLVFGVAHQAGAMRYHAWVDVRTRDGWTSFDPTLRQFPTDATHLRLSSGGVEAQAAVLGATGRLTLQVLSTEEEP